MNILETHIHKLCLKLDYNVLNKYKKEWEKIKEGCENTDNKYLVEEIKEYCKLESNKNLPYLNRCEGGLGGDDNKNNKQIRFRTNNKTTKEDDNILLYVLDSDLKIEKWTYEELDDILRSLIKVLNKKIKNECVKGCIEIYNENMFDDNYFDSDDE
jgi:hypothetical protein